MFSCSTVAISLHWWFPLLCRHILFWYKSRLFLLLLPLILSSNPKKSSLRSMSRSLPCVFFQKTVSGLQLFNPFWVDLCVWYKIGIQFHHFACGYPVVPIYYNLLPPKANFMLTKYWILSSKIDLFNPLFLCTITVICIISMLKFVLFKLVQFKCNRIYSYSLLYVSIYLYFIYSYHFISFCECELPSGVTSSQPEGFPLVFLLTQQEFSPSLPVNIFISIFLQGS